MKQDARSVRYDPYTNHLNSLDADIADLNIGPNSPSEMNKSSIPPPKKKNAHFFTSMLSCTRHMDRPIPQTMQGSLILLRTRS
mmetsp:Transcript_18096/g.31397  ORF Transcript_18096/g.31397 Transcript_18096/m.31397 type:complete len:83 (-) Transcript_18096:436-684(-)